MSIQMEEESNELKNFIKAWTAVIASLFYCYFITSKIPKGIPRLISHLPIIVLFVVLPLSLSSSLLCGFTAFFVTWLASSKLLQFSFGYGPLAKSPISLLRFVLIACLPIKIRDTTPLKESDPVKKQRNFFSRFPNLWPKVAVFYVLLYACDHWRNRVPAAALQCMYCALLYLCLDHALLICCSLIESILDVELYPPFDEPYLSTSLQDFWSRRWNLMVVDALRHTVYKPVRWIFRGKWWALYLGVAATFLVSGLMHELTLFYLTRVSPTWEITWFFVVHGVCVGLEMGLKRKLGGKLRLHWALSGVLSIGFLVWTGLWLFFPQFVRNGVDVRVIEEFKGFLGLVRGLILYQ